MARCQRLVISSGWAIELRGVVQGAEHIATKIIVPGGRLITHDGPCDEPAPIGAYPVYDVADREG